jgi:hypothetical protein
MEIISILVSVQHTPIMRIIMAVAVTYHTCIHVIDSKICVHYYC